MSWIGAQLCDWKSHGGAPGVTETIAPEKMNKVKVDCQQLLQAEPLYAHDLRRFTGLVTWVSGILPMISVNKVAVVFEREPLERSHAPMSNACRVLLFNNL